MIEKIMISRRLKQLRDCLVFEHEILRNGDLKKLSSVAQKREELLNVLTSTSSGYPREDIEPLQTLAKENLRLLASVLKGMNEAKAEVTKMHNAQNSLGTYMPNGQKFESSANKAQTTRRI